MSNQIQESFQPLNPEDHLCDPFDSTLCLSGHHSRPCCASCDGRRPSAAASIPMKRRSPTPSNALQDPISYHPQPTPKRLFIDQEDNDHVAHGFSKIDLPFPFPPAAQPVPLRRTVSDPTEARFGASFDHPPEKSDRSPENVNSTPLSGSKRVCSGSSLPPLPPLPLRRTVSDPNPSPESIPLSPGKFNGLIKEESPDSKRLRRIKEHMKEMNQRWKEVMREEEEDEEKGSEEEIDETVGVERVGDSLKLHLKCSCGKAFEILLSGRSCFYKLL